MTRLNLLQKLAPTGVAAFTVITATASSMFFAPSAQAQDGPPLSCFFGTAGALGVQGSVQCGDKLFDNFSIIPSSPVIVPDLTVSIGQTAGGSFFLTVTQPPLGVQGPFTRSLNYDITITDPNKAFNTVGFDTDVDQIADRVDAFKNVEILDVFPPTPVLDPDVEVGDTLTLESINGNPSPTESILGATKIRISDVIDAEVTSTVFSVTNTYTQVEVRDVPEPSAMLGLAALGGLGLSLKRKKQS